MVYEYTFLHGVRTHSLGGGTDKPAVATDCPERLYVMERILKMKFMPSGAREVHANTLEMCQQM